MNGNLPVGAVSPLSLSVPGYSARAPAPASARSFGAVLAGSPAPGPLPSAPTQVLHDAARTRSLIPLATRLPVAAGEQFAGRALAAADLTVAGWPPVTERLAVSVAATRDQAHAIVPPDPMSRRVLGRL
jgi:hypothetical protein